METSTESTSPEKARRPIALAIHGTSSRRAEQLIEEGFDPKKSTNLAGRMEAFYYRFHPKTIPPEPYIESSWERASLAVDKDRATGVDSKPVLIVFEPPPAISILGRVIMKNPFSKTPQEGSFRKRYRARILAVIPLPHLGSEQFKRPEERARVISDLQNRILAHK
ncbi:hypothetical protein HYW42_00970 [Candidatus Daviesbacteria bacterium]|nr:hypothetical protein [Candidatus Daviesbacteria bacterium]